MFETVIPRAGTARRRLLLYGMLPLSIAIHVLAAGAMLVSAVWNVGFPLTSPKMYMAYSLAAAPPPPPPPPPPPKRVVLVKTAPVRMPLVAPTVIPDTIPVVVAEATEPELPGAMESGVEGGVEGGIEGGEIGGVLGGVEVAPPPPPKPPEPAIIEIKRDDPLPMVSVSQEYPPYPEYARTRGWEDVLVVRYRIGKDGRIKEVSVVTPPAREEFARTTLDTIRYWRFQPFIGENGQPKEVVHELTVEFKIRRVRGG